MTTPMVTLADLPKVLKQLMGQAAAQDAQLSFYERELDGYLKKHKALEGSPVSVQSRVEEAMKTLEHEQKRFVHIMQKQTGRSITLFWHQQLLIHEFEFARQNQDHELQIERARIFDLAFEQIHALLPKAVPLPTPNLKESGGRLAVTLSQAQGHTLQTAKKLLELEEQEESLEKHWIMSEVSIENANAATSLSDFETYVMDWTLGDGQIPDPRRTGSIKGIGMGVLSELDSNGQQLYEQTRSLERDVMELRERLAIAIDATEENQTQQAAEMLLAIRSIFQKYENALPKSQNKRNHSQPMPF